MASSSVVEDLVEIGLVELEQRARRLARFDEQREDALAVFLEQQRQHRRDVRGQRFLDDLAELRIRAMPQQLRQKLLIRPRAAAARRAAQERAEPRPAS